MLETMATVDQKKSEMGDAVLADRLREVGLRPTRQRMALVDILLSQGNRHMTAESLYSEATSQGAKVSLATVYNALHTFTAKGLLREISIDSTQSYFDTNTKEHHHFYFEKSGKLEDIEPNHVKLSRVPNAPDGMSISRVDVVIRVDG
jgi:Fur family iron response transcriptional regulator|tara:strand:+ start:50 stop:493 length:444 start_codon:yes stop_codon:yes gene_type:complete